MCNVRYEYTNKNSLGLLEEVFERVYVDYLGYCYECRLCKTILKTAYDALMHLHGYHKARTLNDLENAKRSQQDEKQNEEQDEGRDEKQGKEQDKKRDEKQNNQHGKKQGAEKQSTLLRYLRK